MRPMVKVLSLALLTVPILAPCDGCIPPVGPINPYPVNLTAAQVENGIKLEWSDATTPVVTVTRAVREDEEWRNERRWELKGNTYVDADGLRSGYIYGYVVYDGDGRRSEKVGIVYKGP